ncbi:unnamed protein product [Brachionus calyciflorus]|uniref:Uncharacterized protein n=1 Tax=Brachionus calyciflorus TaxID=104777 RepID=A0A813MFC0_9BILA|nr:unnamed protein product [Brachionus calyciflorus]
MDEARRVILEEMLRENECLKDWDKSHIEIEINRRIRLNRTETSKAKMDEGLICDILGQKEMEKSKGVTKCEQAQKPNLMIVH